MLTVFLLVEDDILGVPRIRRNVFNLSVRYASSSPGRRASLLVMIPLEKAWLRFPLCIVFLTLSLVGVGAKRLQSKLYAERSETARQTRLLDVILPKAFSSGRRCRGTRRMRCH